jgi:ParB family chromosome partitioning protein
LSLAENFAREPVHPLDEAEAFARLASVECRGVAAIASDFGVTEQYVRQRMKLASLAVVVKDAFRQGLIGVGIAEAFAAVPEHRQVELWQETGGQPRHAQQVRNLIENAWIPATHALFDASGIDPASISHDLFGGDVLIERSAFLAA